jgi:hypothetical protein
MRLNYKSHVIHFFFTFEWENIYSLWYNFFHFIETKKKPLKKSTPNGIYILKWGVCAEQGLSVTNLMCYCRFEFPQKKKRKILLNLLFPIKIVKKWEEKSYLIYLFFSTIVHPMRPKKDYWTHPCLFFLANKNSMISLRIGNNRTHSKRESIIDMSEVVKCNEIIKVLRKQIKYSRIVSIWFSYYSDFKRHRIVL